MTFSTDLRMTSRRGFSTAAFNTNELEWNASISQSMLKDKALTLRLEAFDLLGQQSQITRSLTALARTDAWTNMLNQYVMLHAIYRLNIFGGAKLPEPPRRPSGRRASRRQLPSHAPGNNAVVPAAAPATDSRHIPTPFTPHSPNLECGVVASVRPFPPGLRPKIH